MNGYVVGRVIARGRIADPHSPGESVWRKTENPVSNSSWFADLLERFLRMAVSSGQEREPEHYY
jgi:hypothetical protein